MWLSGLRSQCCYCCWCGAGSISGPGTSGCHGRSQKQRTKQKPRKKTSLSMGWVKLGGGYFLAEGKVATGKRVEDGQRVFQTLSFIPLSLGLLYIDLRGNKRSSDVLPSSLISVIISLHSSLVNPGRESTCCDTQKQCC